MVEFSEQVNIIDDVTVDKFGGTHVVIFASPSFASKFSMTAYTQKQSNMMCDAIVTKHGLCLEVHYNKFFEGHVARAWVNGVVYKKRVMLEVVANTPWTAVCCLYDYVVNVFGGLPSTKVISEVTNATKEAF